jgi:hypothetical protein
MDQQRYQIGLDGKELVIVDTDEPTDPIVARFHNPQRAAFVLSVLNGEMSIGLLLGLPTAWLKRQKERRPT